MNGDKKEPPYTRVSFDRSQLLATIRYAEQEAKKNAPKGTK